MTTIKTPKTKNPTRLAPLLELVDSLGIDAITKDIDATLAAILIESRGLLASIDRVQTARAQMEEAKALLLISGTIDGKNAEIREAQLTLALKDDPEYEAALRALHSAEEVKSIHELALTDLRSKEKALNAKLRAKTAIMELLAS